MRLRHLVVRFFGSLRAASLTPSEQVEAERLLRESERSLFWRQQPIDQRHALECARRVLAEAPDRSDLAEAALLHDVGKRHARLGIVGRVVASLLAIARVPAPGRLRSYLEHGRLGAADLVAAGAGPLTVAFAAHHHDPEAPPGIDPGDWAILRRADDT